MWKVGKKWKQGHLVHPNLWKGESNQRKIESMVGHPSTKICNKGKVKREKSENRVTQIFFKKSERLIYKNGKWKNNNKVKSVFEKWKWMTKKVKQGNLIHLDL